MKTIVLLFCSVFFLVVGCSSRPPVGGVDDGSSSIPSVRNYEYQAYYVQKGDTLYSLGHKFDVSWGKIQRVNGCSPQSLKVGQLLLIPVGPNAGNYVAPEPSGKGDALQNSTAEGGGEQRSHLLKDLRSQKGLWWWPAEGDLAYGYNSRVRGFREPGIGIRSDSKSPVVATRAGEVICAIHRGPNVHKGWGNVVVLKHSDGNVSWYGYLAAIYVKEGENVEKGEPIGSVGQSGAAKEPCLAFRLFENERPVNPLEYLR